MTMPPTPDWLDRYFAPKPLPAPLTPEESIVAKLAPCPKDERVSDVQFAHNVAKYRSGMVMARWLDATPQAQLAELERLGGLT